MAALEDLNNNTDLMIAVASMLEFYNDPPSQIFVSKYESGIKRIYRQDDKINVFIQSPGYKGYFPNTCGGVVKVETLEELEGWMEKLLSKPSLVDVHCRRVSPTGDHSEQLVRDGYFAVIINPNNSHMKNQIEKALDEARSAIKAGKRFILEFDIGGVIKEWFSEKVKDQVHCQYGKIVMANTYIYEDIEEAFCGTTRDKFLCCACFLGSSSIYTLHRLLLCRNINVRLSGKTTQFSPQIDGAIATMDITHQELTDKGKTNTLSTTIDKSSPDEIETNHEPEKIIPSTPFEPATLVAADMTSQNDSNQKTEKEVNDVTLDDTQPVHETTEDTANLVVYYV
ncbi:uncharacterized protein [Ptychodera flava]|uniref:uncharacterized protein n=1 Tax=Ptychodera flava TaxID=63121 RepID=UPI003969D7F3